ncbi:hypothetical protein V5O48_012310 [Marasmius crinis-equi]|uniref:Uncharacterized protein n=1 Tax=Marasmius crinis-equi TaxID=585013 RepID=A0ABR3F334_9AGAR
MLTIPTLPSPPPAIESVEGTHTVVCEARLRLDPAAFPSRCHLTPPTAAQALADLVAPSPGQASALRRVFNAFDAPRQRYPSMAPAQSRFLQPRRSLRIAISQLAQGFPNASDVVPRADVTVQALTTFLEDVALLRHLETNPELQNTDPALAVIQRHVEKELARGNELNEAGKEDRIAHKRQRERDEPGLGLSDAKRSRRAQAPSLVESFFAAKPSKKARKRKRQKENRKAKKSATELTTCPAVSWRLREEPELEPGEVVLVDFSAVPDNLHGPARQKARRAVRKAANKAADLGREIATPNAGLQDALKNSRMASTGWQGVNAPRDERQLIRALVQGGMKLDGIAPMPYRRKALILPSQPAANVTYYMLTTLLPQVNLAARKFMQAVKWPSEEDMAENLRGEHFFCIAGHDRNNKEKPALSQWHLLNAAVLDSFFAKGEPLEVLTRYGCQLVRNVFPPIAERFERCGMEMEKKFGIKPLYGGLFFNFCLNGVRMKGPNPIPRVFCKPHVDFKNLALAVCMVFVYGHFNHREKCWIVIWEAGVALELPMGVFVLYPSSLFLHFNVDVANLNFVVTDGERPTKENSKPLNCLCGNPEADHGEAWERAQGRGSMVWFNQASMFQTTELGYNTVAQARAANATTECNAEAWLNRGIFPSVSLDK